MTFEEWWQKEKAGDPLSASPFVRERMAACWNAALDAVRAECGFERLESGGMQVGIYKISEIYLDSILRAPLPIKFEGEMQKFSQ